MAWLQLMDCPMLKSLNATVVSALGVFLANSLWAIPSLQLDTNPGMYDPVTQTTIATSNPFTLRALVNGTSGGAGSQIADALTRTFYISAAIIPSPGAIPTPNFGSFSVNGTPYSSSSGMQYGFAPVDSTILTRDMGDLQTHGIFPTWYAEFGFTVSAANMVPAYNVQDDTTAPGSLYYVDFTINIAGLYNQPNSPYAVHFDLYDIINHPDRDVQDFAPFSHDAESGHGIIIQQHPAPDSGLTIAMLGFAIAGFGVLRRKLA